MNQALIRDISFGSQMVTPCT